MKRKLTYVLIGLFLIGCNAASPARQTAFPDSAIVNNQVVVPYCASTPISTSTPASALGISSLPNSMASKTCVVELPMALYSNSYCSNPDANWGGVTITIPPLGPNDYVTYPKNCQLQKSKNGNNQVLVCSGPAGSSFNITVVKTCQPPAAMAPDLEPFCPKPYYAVSKNPNDQYCALTGFVVPTPGPVNTYCPAGYKPAYKSVRECEATDKNNTVPKVPVVCPQNYAVDKYGSCTWSPPKCSAGYEFSSAGCCQPAPTYPPIRTCPEGYSVVNGMCKSDSRDVRYSDSKVYTFTEGDCNKPLPSDKPAPAMPTPTICSDPAGGCP